MTLKKFDWIKINSAKDLPEFDKPVLLYQKRYDKHYVMVGSLQSIDSKGFNWSHALNGGAGFDFNSIFGGSSGSGFLASDRNFQPTHWCEVIVPVPEDE